MCPREGWRNGSAVKSTDCSSRGPEFNSQQPHCGSQPSVIGILMPSSELNKNPVEGFLAGLIDDNDLYCWEVLIIGPPDTLYEGGVFKAYLIFPKDYPLWPSKMKFITDIWPPNGKLPLIWNKIKTGWSSLVPDTGKLSWPRQQSSVRHVDIDCFFVSGAIRNITDLKGKTVALSATMAQEGHLFIVVLTSNWGGSITKIKS
ncbi:ubiquitin-conjugating enzyme E2 J2-like isoform X2 [Apodemus sylvaticus]|uniref:ubiquitin-conjugating enzyme E2 J2-like isoform X2 n=1 Tax=Apodemus sylvaticus TaxID=10129 RepID=UPI002243F154|nr:ubiquitin-conjugating enzyme E2 J2-like isoform X2 [Apodemus sylvaticus]